MRAGERMVHYYYGNGKGKTSAAVGACIRAVGNGMRCAFVQFHKSGGSGEIALLRSLGIEVRCCPAHTPFFREMTAQQIQDVTAVHNRNLEEIALQNYDLIVLDELGDALLHGTVDADAVSHMLQKSECEWIVTGHKPVPLLLDCADYLTAFQCEAHPFRNGIPARKGIEY